LLIKNALAIDDMRQTAKIGQVTDCKSYILRPVKCANTPRVLSF